MGARRGRWVIAVLALAVGSVGVGAACSDAPERRAETATADRPAAEAARGRTDAAAADSTVVYVDVRTEREYEAGHIKGAINIPHTEMDERYDELERYEEREIVVYCQSGRRSGIAKGILESQGFGDVTNAGGLRDLRAQGVPTTANCC